MSTPISNNTNALRTLLNSTNELPRVQYVAGQFTTNSNGEATVNCGFLPDFVGIQVEPPLYNEENGMTVAIELAAEFLIDKNIKVGFVYSPTGESNGYPFVSTYIRQITGGFGVLMQCFSASMDVHIIPNESFNYFAIKVTP